MMPPSVNPGVRAVAVEEIDNKPVLIDTRGKIRIHAAGLATDELEAEIETPSKNTSMSPT
jgi:hypothetical protein